MNTDNKNSFDLKKNKYFILSSLIILIIFVFIYFYYADALNKPSACLCANSFNADSAVSLPSAKKLVGNGHYEFTIQTARRDCLNAYQLDILNWEKTNHKSLSTAGDEAAFFTTFCPEKSMKD
ncbi:MAG: hypothetical protein ACRC2O_11430 [Chitinophagaceae bacterium]